MLNFGKRIFNLRKIHHFDSAKWACQSSEPQIFLRFWKANWLELNAESCLYSMPSTNRTGQTAKAVEQRQLVDLAFHDPSSRWPCKCLLGIPKQIAQKRTKYPVASMVFQTKSWTSEQTSWRQLLIRLPHLDRSTILVQMAKLAEWFCRNQLVPGSARSRQQATWFQAHGLRCIWSWDKYQPMRATFDASLPQQKEALNTGRLFL